MGDRVNNCSREIREEIPADLPLSCTYMIAGSVTALGDGEAAAHLADARTWTGAEGPDEDHGGSQSGQYSE